MKRSHDPVGQYERIGLGLNWQIIKSKQGFKELEIPILEEAYQDCKRKVIMIDHESVIPMKYNNGKSGPSSEILNALNALSSNPQNIVMVVSTESKVLLHQWYQKAPNVGLAAENGFFWRWNSKGKKKDEW